MYRNHFAMTAYPFDTTLNTDELYSSATLLEASARVTSSPLSYFSLALIPG